jgi:hypothetical protein
MSGRFFSRPVSAGVKSSSPEKAHFSRFKAL